MNESIKDRFLKEHALNDDDLEKVSGGIPEFGIDYEIVPCECPKCGGVAWAIHYFDTEKYFDISCSDGCYTAEMY